MLGSVADAEDALQETLLRAWRGLASFEGRSSLRSWLYAIATNACLRAIERRPKRVLPIDYAPAVDPTTASASPWSNRSGWSRIPTRRSASRTGSLVRRRVTSSARASKLAFIAALQHLPARQRAVLILRDVLGFSAREVAATLKTTPTGVDSALQRAHEAVDERLSERSQQAMLRSLDDHGLREIVDRYVDAFERADVDAVVEMLAADGAMTMPPLSTWYPRARGGGRLPRGRGPEYGQALAPRSGSCEPAAGVRQLPLGGGAGDLQAAQHLRAHARPRGDRRDHHLPRSRADSALRAAGRLLPERWISSPGRIPTDRAAIPPPNVRKERARRC